MRLLFLTIIATLPLMAFGEEPAEVIVETIQSAELFDSANYTGWLEPRYSRTVQAEVSGTLIKLVDQLGTQVRQGQVIGIIQPQGGGLEYQPHQVRAPISGMILKTQGQLGQAVTAGADLLAIGQVAPLKTVLHLTPDDAASVRAGAKLRATSAGQSTPEQLKVEHISPIADASLGTFAAEIKVECKVCAVGAMVHVQVLKNFRQGVRVPMKWLSSGNSKALTISAEGKAEWRSVKVGQYFGEDVEITSGLNVGDRVATGTSKRPKDGDLVKIVTKEEVEGISAKPPEQQPTNKG
jgi:multidrug efflux pump subunit AcrA (membrane-fusion protein)